MKGFCLGFKRCSVRAPLDNMELRIMYLCSVLPQPVESNNSNIEREERVDWEEQIFG